MTSFVIHTGELLLHLAKHGKDGAKIASKLGAAETRHATAVASGDTAAINAAEKELNGHRDDALQFLSARGGGGSKAPTGGGNAKAKSAVNTAKSKTSGSSSSSGGGGLKSKATVLGTGALLGTALFSGGGGEDSPLGVADKALGRLTGDCHDYVGSGSGNGGVIAMDHEVCTALANALEHLADQIEHDMIARRKVYDETIESLKVEGHVPPVYQDFAAALDGMKAKHVANTHKITARLRSDAKILHAAVAADIEKERRMAARVHAIDV